MLKNSKLSIHANRIIFIALLEINYKLIENKCKQEGKIRCKIFRILLSTLSQIMIYIIRYTY